MGPFAPACEDTIVSGAAIYNLEFRSYSHSIEVGGFRFERVPEYAERQARLQYLVSIFGFEYPIICQTGGHAHTANILCPDVMPPARIFEGYHQVSALDDVLLLLKLFTGRDVFTPKCLVDDTTLILADFRLFPRGGVLQCSIPHTESETRDELDRPEDVTLSTHLPRIYERVCDPEWQCKYNHGHFLVLLGYAIQQRLLESAFGQCWTIWEHLFACLTDSWMSERANRNLSAKEKISFLLVHFALRDNLANTEKSRLDDLVAIRNRLVHFGRFPDQNKTVRSDAAMFVRMAEYIAAKALGLFPSNIFNTIAQLEMFLKKDSDKQKANAK